MLRSTGLLFTITAARFHPYLQWSWTLKFGTMNIQNEGARKKIGKQTEQNRTGLFPSPGQQEQKSKGRRIAEEVSLKLN